MPHLPPASRNSPNPQTRPCSVPAYGKYITTNVCQGTVYPQVRYLRGTAAGEETIPPRCYGCRRRGQLESRRCAGFYKTGYSDNARNAKHSHNSGTGTHGTESRTIVNALVAKATETGPPSAQHHETGTGATRWADARQAVSRAVEGIAAVL